MVTNVAIFGAFLLIVSTLGFFLWQTLFGSHQYGESAEKGAISQSEQKPGYEDSFGRSAAKPAHNSTEEAIAYYTKWLSYFTLCLVLATIALFVSGERNVEVAGRSAEAAKDAAKAAQASVQLAEQNAERQLRAYISIFSSQIGYGQTYAGDGKTGMGITINITLRNSGQTPAYKFTSWLVAPKILPSDSIPWAEKPAEFESLRKGILGSGVTNDLLWTMPMTDQELADVNNGIKKIFMWGGADYTDAFGRQRYYKFRATNQSGAVMGAGGGWKVVPEGEEGD